MELPIRIMIVLFVALIVGALMIAFAREVLFPRETIIPDFGAEENDDGVLTFETLKNDHVISLAKTCIEENRGTTLERKRCFVILAQNSEFIGDDVWYELSEAYPRMNIEVSFDLEDSSKSMVIYYDPTTLNNTLEISPT